MKKDLVLHRISNDCLVQAIVTIMESGIGVDMMQNISCYPHPDGTYCVDFCVDEVCQEVFGLTTAQTEMLEEEGELSEYFDNAEDAAELFLTLKQANEKLCNRPAKIRRSFTDRLTPAHLHEETKLVAVEAH